MNLAIIHYHLSRGGVRQVIENQLASLDAVLDSDQHWQVALLFGGRRDGFDQRLAEQLRQIDLTFCEVPALDYDEQRAPGDLRNELAAALTGVGFAPDETLLHVHNHALGKNVALPASLAHLAHDGFAQLLQIHDFAEDLRPLNYRRLSEAKLPTGLHPQAANIHYAVLNGRDRRILEAAGVPSGRLHWLPNPVPPINHLPEREAARKRLAERFHVEPHERLVLYPVRGIRRKNVGETLLHAVLAPPETVVGLTLAPQNPAELPFHEGWKELAAELGLSCRFELGEPDGLSFSENLAAADLIITTSVAEGFGMVFLESWLAGCPLLGRDLPEITSDFTEAGLRLNWLHSRLDVPLEWIGINTFQRTILEAYQRTIDAYDRDEPENLLDLLEKRTEGGVVDFGDLDETLQQQVIRMACRSETDRLRVLDANPWIEAAWKTGGNRGAGTIEHNVGVIEEHYGLEPSGHRLLRTYEAVMASRRGEMPEPLAHGERILDFFLDFARFRPIRS